MRIASIDIGTNTILLLVAEIQNSEIIPLKEEFRIPRLGRSLSTTQKIEEEAQVQLIQILNDYKQIAKDYGIKRIICGGTAVFRNSKNSKEVLQRVKAETGLQINVLSSEQEAFFTFLGGISNFKEFFDKIFTIIDIGGGSTEIVVGNLSEIKFLKSYNIGAVILKDLYFNTFPYQFPEKVIYEKLNYVFQDDLHITNSIVIAVAGTPTTLASIYHNQKIFDEKKVEKTYLNLNFLNKLVSKFYNLSSHQIKEKFPSIVEGREDVILPGTVILKFIVEKLNVDGFYVSARGIRYGLIIYELMNQGDGFWTKVGLRKFISSL